MAETDPLSSRSLERKDITKLLRATCDGDGEAAERLFAWLYDDLLLRARSAMRSQAPQHTLQPTALLHEAYCKLVQGEGQDWRSRRHFMAVAARAMRSILVDHYRAKKAGKRPSCATGLPLDQMVAAYQTSVPDLAALHEALERLAVKDARMAEIVDLHYFGGFTPAELAETFEITPRTVYRELDLAKAVLLRELEG